MVLSQSCLDKKFSRLIHKVKGEPYVHLAKTWDTTISGDHISGSVIFLFVVTRFKRLGLLVSITARENFFTEKQIFCYLDFFLNSFFVLIMLLEVKFAKI